MPKQLIYTSAPRGIVPGQSGYCTVARSDEMREALILRLEQLSYYQHLSLSGGTERPISAYRIVDIRGTRYHVLSKIQDAGLDFTGRTNFIAHHLVFEPKEIGGFPSPPVILRDWPDWKTSWTQEPELLKNEDSVWNKIKNLAVKSNGEAKTWRVVTGNAENGYGLLDALRGTSFRVDDQTDIFGLFAESLELLEVRRKGFPNAAWDFTFTTSMQEQDNPADFLWRCIHSDNPAANRLATPDYRELAAAPMQLARCSDEEKAFANQGRQPPRFVEQPKNQHIREGEDAVFTAKAEGIPTPKYQWYECDQKEKEIKPIEGQTSSMLALKNCKQGTTRYRVWATNGVGNDSQSVPVKLEVEPAEKPKSALKIATVVRTPTLYNVKTADDIERDRARHRDIKEQEDLEKRQQLKKILKICTAFIFILAIGVLAFVFFRHPKQPDNNGQIPATNNPAGNSPVLNSQTNASNQTTQAEIVRDTTTNKNLGTVSDGVKISATNSPPKTLQMPDYSPPSTNKASTNAQALKGAKNK